jgi:hypothetical protein
MKLSSGTSISTLLAALLPLICSSPACAQDTGFYVKADVGGGVTMDTDLNAFFGPVAPGSKVTFDPGLRYGLAAGYQFTHWFALEAEFGSMVTKIDQITDATPIVDFANGGSAADAQHFSSELMHRVEVKEIGIRALALHQTEIAASIEP